MRRTRPRHLPHALATAVVLALAAVGCSSSTSPTSPTPPPPTQPPPPPAALSITCPASQTSASANGNSVAVSFPAPTTAGGVAPVQVSCTRSSGSLFPVGSTEVRCTATDAANASRSCSFMVVVTPPPPQLTHTKFLAFGDSMTVGEIAVTSGGPFRTSGPNTRLIVVPSAAYPVKLLSLLRARYPSQINEITVTNAGKHGEWAEDGAARLPGVLSSERPEAVLLLEGSNDLAALGMPGLQRAWVAIDRMAKEIRGRGARAFIATLPPPNPSGNRAIPASLIEALNANIRVTVRGEGAVLVDLYEALSADVNRYISLDGLHPSEAGYQKIAETFEEAIRQEFERK